MSMKALKHTQKIENPNLRAVKIGHLRKKSIRELTIQPESYSINLPPKA